MNIYGSDEVEAKAVADARSFYEQYYGETAHAAIFKAMAEYAQRRFLEGGNYGANDDTFPSEITFANGRRVGIAFDGDKPYLTVGRI